MKYMTLICAAFTSAASPMHLYAQENPSAMFVPNALPFPANLETGNSLDASIVETFNGDADAAATYITETERERLARAEMETQCGAYDDSQHVEFYDGTLGASEEFVSRHQSSVGQIQWNYGLSVKYVAPNANAGNVEGERWCTGTLIAEDLFLTAGHCFDQSGNGWIRPSRKVNGNFKPISPSEIAQNMHVNFNYQLNKTTNTIIDVSTFPIVKLLENWKGGLDFALVRLGANEDGQHAGDVFKTTNVSKIRPKDQTVLTVIQHPAGEPKKVEIGPLTSTFGKYLHYNDIDTRGGSSGSGVLDQDGEIVGVHVQGGCSVFGSGSNKATAISSIRRVSDFIK